MLAAATKKHRRRPKYVVTDQGVQFREAYLAWCAKRGIAARYGAVGRHGSIAIVERFWRSLKAEAFPSRMVPLGLDAVRALLLAYVGWFNEHRPHQGLAGSTPLERATGVVPAKDLPRLEPRARYPDRGDGSIREPRPKELLCGVARIERDGAPACRAHRRRRVDRGRRVRLGLRARRSRGERVRVR